MRCEPSSTRAYSATARAIQLLRGHGRRGRVAFSAPHRVAVASRARSRRARRGRRRRSSAITAFVDSRCAAPRPPATTIAAPCVEPSGAIAPVASCSRSKPIGSCITWCASSSARWSTSRRGGGPRPTWTRLLRAGDNEDVSPPAPPHALFLDRVCYPADLYLCSRHEESTSRTAKPTTVAWGAGARHHRRRPHHSGAADGAGRPAGANDLLADICRLASWFRIAATVGARHRRPTI